MIAIRANALKNVVTCLCADAHQTISTMSAFGTRVMISFVTVENANADRGGSSTR